MIRLALADIDTVKELTFDLQRSRLRVTHKGRPEPVTKKLAALGFHVTLESTTPANAEDVKNTPESLVDNTVAERFTLRLLLSINGLMFLIELAVGCWAQSTGLIADSLDNFADAAVYALALYAVGKSAKMKLRSAHLAGWFQLVLALGALSEVIRRFLFGSNPDSLLMIAMAGAALVANISCLFLISKTRESGVHMKASWIFSANDVIANSGVILAGLFVAWTGSRYPDLIIGLIIGVIVLTGAYRILKL